MTNLRDTFKTRWKALATAGMAVVLLGAGSGVALNRYARTTSGDDCCARGAPCCHHAPSPCCARRHGAARP